MNQRTFNIFVGRLKKNYALALQGKPSTASNAFP
jgi:hypothetical protein